VGAAGTNDADGNFNPPFGGPLPSTTEQALQFKFAANALSTNNANDYAVTPGAATFTKNSGTTATITQVAGVEPGMEAGQLMLSPPAPNPVRSSMSYSFVLPRDARAQVRALVDERLSAGRHSFTCDARGDGGAALSSGLYFLELNAGGARKAQRFALIR